MELMLCWVGTFAFRSSQHHTFRLLPCQGFLGSLTDKVALYLSRQSEGKGEHLAPDVVAEAIAVFDGPHTTLLGHADVEDLHDHKQVAAKAR